MATKGDLGKREYNSQNDEGKHSMGVHKEQQTTRAQDT